MQFIYKIISWIFVPLMMPVYTLAVMFFTETVSKTSIDIKENPFLMNPYLKIVTLIIFFILLVIAPGLSLIIMQKNRQIESIELDNRRERSIPILITGFYSFVLTIILFKQLSILYFPVIIHSIAVLGVVSSLVAFIITLRAKISLHALASGLSAGTIIYYFYYFYIPNITVLLTVILIGGLIMTARYGLKKHTINQLISGYLIGLLLSFTTLTIVKTLL